MIARQGWWKGVFGDKSLKKVDLVAKELEDNFTIYSNDQVEARALLTPDRMERLIALERHFKGGKLRGIFEGDHLTLALEAKDQVTFPVARNRAILRLGRTFANHDLVGRKWSSFALSTRSLNLIPTMTFGN